MMLALPYSGYSERAWAMLLLRRADMWASCRREPRLTGSSRPLTLIPPTLQGDCHAARPHTRTQRLETVGNPGLLLAALLGRRTGPRRWTARSSAGDGNRSHREVRSLRGIHCRQQDRRQNTERCGFELHRAFSRGRGDECAPGGLARMGAAIHDRRRIAHQRRRRRAERRPAVPCLCPQRNGYGGCGRRPHRLAQQLRLHALAGRSKAVGGALDRELRQ
jgi:hypothetical protein